jgi:glucose-1-phosphate thymidylyltransferase
MRGIILAGGFGTRLRPLTYVTNKHLLPVYDKPMILYPIATLKNAGINDILIVHLKDHAEAFNSFLGSGEKHDVKISYAGQEGAGGIAEALGLAEDFAGGQKIAVILGDNLFEDNFPTAVREFEDGAGGAKIFVKQVPDPERFGIAEIADDKVLGIEEKPVSPKSNYAVLGFYFYDTDVFDKIKNLTPSARGELEITDLNNMYIREGKMTFAPVEGQWFDAGTFESLLEASNWFGKKQ